MITLGIEMNPTIAKIIEFFGTQETTAKAVGCSQATIFKWLHKKMNVSTFYALKIEKLTNGQFRAVDLCPKLKELEDLSPPKDTP